MDSHPDTAPGARLSPDAARPNGGESRNIRAALRSQCCCGWGQPRPGPSSMPAGAVTGCDAFWRACWSRSGGGGVA